MWTSGECDIMPRDTQVLTMRNEKIITCQDALWTSSIHCQQVACMAWSARFRLPGSPPCQYFSHRITHQGLQLSHVSTAFSRLDCQSNRKKHMLAKSLSTHTTSRGEYVNPCRSGRTISAWRCEELTAEVSIFPTSIAFDKDVTTTATLFPSAGGHRRSNVCKTPLLKSRPIRNGWLLSVCVVMTQ